MELQAATAKSDEPVSGEWAEGPRYMARQPILDLRGKAHGYHVLLRNGLEGDFLAGTHGAAPARFDNTVQFGLEELTGGLPAFVNCTGEELNEQLADHLPPNLTVLEIRESVEPAASLVVACQKLKGLGFRLALHDFAWKPGYEALLDLANYIKIDFNTADERTRQGRLRHMMGKSAALIAENIETPQQHLQAKTEGFKLFQGYFFCHPTLLKSRNIPTNRLFHIQILNMLHSPSVDFRKLSELVKQDAALTYRLLRLVNSPLCAVRQEVRSIETALLAVGEDNFRHIATLAIANEMSANQPIEVLRMAFVRGRFCEMAAPQCALDPGEQYLLGLISLLPAMLCVAMDDLTPALPLRDSIREALHGTRNRERKLLDWLESHEVGDWATSDAIVQSNSLNRKQMVLHYSQSVVWADSALSSIA
jgi:EAL and modified HD-GYP domain-containing signal transduction protein